jgi:FkbM family methyltransferase
MIKTTLKKYLINFSKLGIAQYFFKILKALRLKIKFENFFYYRGYFNVSIKNPLFKKSHKIVLYSSGDCIENHFFWHNEKCEWENSERFFWKLITLNSEGVCDIGANSGLFSIIAKVVGCKNVIAFEPLNSNLIKLKKNINLNNLDIKIKEFAVGSKKGEFDFFYGTDYEHNYSASLDVNFVNSLYKNISKQKVQVISLDELGGFSEIDLYKIDIEGNEINALIGMQNLIFTKRPTFIIEILSLDSFQKMEELLPNYSIYSIAPKNILNKCSIETYNQIYTNFLCISNENEKHKKLVKDYILN